MIVVYASAFLSYTFCISRHWQNLRFLKNIFSVIAAFELNLLLMNDLIMKRQNTNFREKRSFADTKDK